MCLSTVLKSPPESDDGVGCNTGRYHDITTYDTTMTLLWHYRDVTMLTWHYYDTNMMLL